MEAVEGEDESQFHERLPGDRALLAVPSPDPPRFVLPAVPIETIADARTFVLAVEGGSLSAAARALQVSPNAVSQRVRAMEQRAGVRLLVRTTRSMSLTEEGEALYRRCVRIVAEADEAADEVGGNTEGLSGRVRAVVPTVLGAAPTLEALGALHAAHPALRVQLVVSDDRALDLVASGVDLALHYGEPAESGLIAKRIGEVAFVLCAAPSYLDARGRPKTPGDLEGHDGLRFLESPPQDTWRLTGPEGRDVEVPVGGWFESDSSRALGDAVYAGLGIGVRPEAEVVASEDRIERVLPGWRYGRAPLVALMPPGRHRLRRVRAVLDVLADVARATVCQRAPSAG